MNMKKIIAGVAAAALTATSLAVVNVSAADTTKTFNFVGKSGTMTISYSKSISFRGGIDPVEVFGPHGTTLDFSYGIKASMKSGYKDDNLGDLNNILGAVKYGNGTKFTVTGYCEKLEKDITVNATAKVNKDGKYETIKTASTETVIPGGVLDLTDIDLLRTLTISNEFSVNTGNLGVPEGVCDISITNSIGLTGVGNNLNGGASYKSETKDGNGVQVTVGDIWAFEGVGGNTVTILDNNGSWDAPVTGTSLGHNLLRWVNDNIEQNKGAKLRINFMTPAQYKDAITKGDLTQYVTVDQDWAHWSGANILVPETSSSSSTNDIMIGVNLQNTSKLQQTKDISNYTVEFNWDELVKSSVATISGNVDSIAFRIQPGSAGAKALTSPADDGRAGSKCAIRSIEIIVPDQTTIPGGNVALDDQVLTVTDEVSGVKAEGTYKTIRGNGGATLVAVGSLTSNKLSYEVKLLDKDSNPVQPAGEITLTLPIPKDNQGKTIKGGTVAHTKGNGTVENLTILNDYKADGYVKVITTSLSPFEMEFEEDETTTEAPETTTEAPETTTEAPATTTEAPETTTAAPAAAGDKNVNTGVAIAIVPAVIAAAGVIISKKRK